MLEQPITRRNWMQRTAAGLKAAALTSIFSTELYGEPSQNKVKSRGPLGQQQRAAQRAWLISTRRARERPVRTQTVFVSLRAL